MVSLSAAPAPREITGAPRDGLSGVGAVLGGLVGQFVGSACRGRGYPAPQVHQHAQAAAHQGGPGHRPVRQGAHARAARHGPGCRGCSASTQCPRRRGVLVRPGGDQGARAPRHGLCGYDSSGVCNAHPHYPIGRCRRLHGYLRPPQKRHVWGARPHDHYRPGYVAALYVIFCPRASHCAGCSQPF